MFVADILFPKMCLGCGLLGVYICRGCEKKLAPSELPICLYCRRPSLHGLTHPLCLPRNGLEGCVSIFHYNPFLKTVIASIKYELATAVWHEFKNCITPKNMHVLTYFKKKAGAVFVPVPLHPLREKNRGFNQAVLVATWLQAYLPFSRVNALSRRRYTSYQARLSSNAKRRDNVRDVFLTTSSLILRNRTVILVDDVVTSGSTLMEAARVCRLNGARHVFAVTLACG